MPCSLFGWVFSIFVNAPATHFTQVYYGQTLDVAVQKFIREAPEGVIMFEIKWGKEVSYVKVVKQQFIPKQSIRSCIFN